MIWVIVGIVFGLIAAVIACLLFLRLKIVIDYKGGEFKIVIKSIFFRYRIDESRLNRLSDSKDKSRKRKKAKAKPKPKTEETAEGFIDKIEKVKNKIIDIKDVLVVVFSYLGPRIEISDIYIKSRFGTGDAAKTGMICGALWSLTGNVYAFLCRFFTIGFPNIELEPMFEQKCFDFEAHGIIKIRLVHIITAVARGSNVYDKHK